jgi:hypothetical protein
MKYGELGTDGTFIFLQWLQCTYYFSNFTKNVFSMQGLWLSSNTLPTMVHGQPPSKDHPDPKAGVVCLDLHVIIRFVWQQFHEMFLELNDY